MSDEINDIPEPEPTDEPLLDESESAGRKKGFLSTRSGKMALIAGLIGVLLVVAASCSVAVYIAWGKFQSGVEGAVDDVVITPPAPPGSNTGTGTTTATAPPASQPATPKPEPLPITNSDVFTLRDPFKALIVPESESSETSGSTDTSGSADSSETIDAGEGVLMLQDIITEDGERKAVLVYETTQYTLGAGEEVPDTPWEVLTVGSNSVTMLYGDTQITLTPGQGMQQDGDGTSITLLK